MRITPEALEEEFSLPTAATRLDWLSRRDSGASTLNSVSAEDPDDWSSIRDAGTSLDAPEALELLALGEVVARKAHGSRLVGIRAALRGGVDWADIGAALGRTPAEAWDSFTAALADDRSLTAEAVASARELAGARP